jgi:DNA-binding winged helix-turn-helix (wHTH) protein
MRYVFADCLLNTQLYTLSRAGRAISLRPKAFHVLRYLLEHRDHLVSKEELCAHVWPAQFISDATIEGCIKRACQAIGDTGRTQQLIQTRRGYGYRFVGAVEERLEAFPAQAPAGTLRLAPAAPPQDAPHRRPDLAPWPGEEPVAAGASTASSALLSSLAPRTAPASTVQSMPGGERKLVTLLGCALLPAPCALRARRGAVEAPPHCRGWRWTGPICAGKRLSSQTVCVIVVAISFLSCNPGDIYGYYNHGRQA